MRQMTPEQAKVVSELIQITLSGNKSSEETVNGLVGRLVELLEPSQRRELSHAIAIHRSTLVLQKLQEMGYVAGP